MLSRTRGRLPVDEDGREADHAAEEEEHRTRESGKVRMTGRAIVQTSSTSVVVRGNPLSCRTKMFQPMTTFLKLLISSVQSLHYSLERGNIWYASSQVDMCKLQLDKEFGN